MLKPPKLVAVALANKMARTAWVLLTKKEFYQVPTFRVQASRREDRAIRGCPQRRAPELSNGERRREKIFDSRNGFVQPAARG